MSNERIGVPAMTGHSSSEVATWTAQQAIAFMAAEMKTYRPDIEAKCNEARAAVAELIGFAEGMRELLSQDDAPVWAAGALDAANAALARVTGGAS